MSTETHSETHETHAQADTHTGEEHGHEAGFEAMFALVAFPLAFLHEAVHALVSAPWAEEFAIIMEPRSRAAAVHVDWDADAPHWGIALAHVAPTMVGLTVAAAVAGTWVGGGTPLPTSLVSWAEHLVAIGAWAVFTAPSRDDLRGALDAF